MDKPIPEGVVGRAHLQAVLNLSEAARCLGVAQAKNDQGAIDYWTDKTNEYEAALTAAQQQGQAAPPSAPVGVETNWPDDYCPECGSSEVRHREGEHIQCGACHQEYFTSIDYSGVVRENLKRLFALAQQPAAVDGEECPHSAIGGCDVCATQHQEPTT